MTINLNIFHSRKSNSWAIKRQKKYGKKSDRKSKERFISSVEPDCHATFNTRALQQGRVRQRACGKETWSQRLVSATSEAPGAGKIWEKQNFLIRKAKCERHHTQTGGGLLWETLITCNDAAFSWTSPWPLCWRNLLNMWAAAAFQRFRVIVPLFLFPLSYLAPCLQSGGQSHRKEQRQQLAMTSQRA